MTAPLSTQFGTVAQVEVIPTTGLGVIVNPDLTPGALQLRVDFSVRKGVGGATPNECQIQIHNLAKTSRARASGITRRLIDFSAESAFLDGRLVTGADLGGTTEISTSNGFSFLRLRARYEGQTGTASLFEGTATRVRSTHKRNTWVTQIEGGDGALQSTAAITDKTWSGDVTMPEVLAYVVGEAMASQIATVLPPSILGVVFVGGYDCTNYYASEILDQMAELYRFEWWWDDGLVYFSEIGQPLPGAPILVSAKPTANAVQLISKPRAIEESKVEITTLLLPSMRAKTPVTILADELAGQYYATAIRHRGSNRRGVSRTMATLTRIGVLPFL